VVRIQRVGPTDWLLLKQTRLAALREAPHAFTRSYAEEAAFTDAAWRTRAEANASDETSAGFLASAAEAEVGLVACLWKDRPQGLVQLVSLWTAPQVRGQGVASALVEAALAWARDVGALACEADVTDENHDAAVFYWRRGFRRVRTQPPRPGVSRWLRQVQQAPAARWPEEEEAVQLFPSDPRWPAKFEDEKRLLTPALRPWLDGELEHIGSTAVPGLLAKPVVDLMAPVSDLEAACEAIPVLESLGYQYAPYRPRLHWFCKPSPAKRDFHLILLERREAEWGRRLAFRNLLRADAARANDYVALKQQASQKHAHDREAYTRAKTRFVEAMTQEALRRGDVARS
jgi:GrpB-like predicted nucleotidyltransferase (UPF0157 family)/ribosomal protein S18 acetylase RimI-like enzyme